LTDRREGNHVTRKYRRNERANYGEAVKFKEKKITLPKPEPGKIERGREKRIVRALRSRLCKEVQGRKSVRLFVERKRKQRTRGALVINLLNLFEKARKQKQRERSLPEQRKGGERKLIFEGGNL